MFWSKTSQNKIVKISCKDGFKNSKRNYGSISPIVFTEERYQWISWKDYLLLDGRQSWELLSELTNGIPWINVGGVFNPQAYYIYLGILIEIVSKQ